MPDFIHQLPDHIANQIAAGEVIQRPASAVKELMENAVDAGATEIRLIVREAGKSLVQVIDNGRGMSETDARLCISRHATSKISSIEDLFRIRTMGFRGEALAAIAAVSQLELRTRQPDSELGTCLVVESSVVEKSEPCACPAGTSVAMKNLFFSVPARRHFLKENPYELRLVIGEFTRVALGFPQLFFSMESNGQEVFHLEKSSLKQRILQVLGSQFNAKLVTVKENTEYMNVFGMVGKPETARKKRDQYFFVNNRYIRSNYLHRGVMQAFEGMIPADSHPLYALYIEVDPAHLDINVHPTKQEIKFEDESLIYAFVKSAVKHALAQYSIMPPLDFGLDPEIQQLPAISQPFTEHQKAAAEESSIYKDFTQKHQAHLIAPTSNLKHWKDLYETGTASSEVGEPRMDPLFRDPSLPGPMQEGREPVQIHRHYIQSQISTGFILIDQQAAQERILYDRFSSTLVGRPAFCQQSLFPQTLHFQPGDAAELNEILPDLAMLGYQLEPFGNHDFILQGTPADISGDNAQSAIEQLLEQVREFSADLKLDRREKLVRAMARQQSFSALRPLTILEMQHIIDTLFACSNPRYAPGGNQTYISFRMEELSRLFGK